MKEKFGKTSSALEGFGPAEPKEDAGSLAGSAFASALKGGDGAAIWEAFQALAREYESMEDDESAPPM